MRQHFESIEEHYLAPYAVKSSESRGRHYNQPECDLRTCFQRDRDRIVHLKAFRRLQFKTQVFIAGESDHYRSRLTHTLEVAQISRHLARLLRVNEDLAEAIALAHDLGHTPFGHSGEDEMNLLMADDGGFEHNLQSRRIVDSLAKRYPEIDGINLTFEVREGLIKHFTPFDKPAGQHKFLSCEAQVANVSDEISYNNHDLDDGLNSGLININDLERNVCLWREASKVISQQFSNLSDQQRQPLIISHLISSQIKDVVKCSLKNINALSIKSVDDFYSISQPVITYTEELQEKNKELRHYLFNLFYTHSHIKKMNDFGKHVIKQLFNTYINYPTLINDDFFKSFQNKYPIKRLVADYIAGMTDVYAQNELHQLEKKGLSH